MTPAAAALTPAPSTQNATHTAIRAPKLSLAPGSADDRDKAASGATDTATPPCCCCCRCCCCCCTAARRRHRCRAGTRVVQPPHAACGRGGGAHARARLACGEQLLFGKQLLAAAATCRAVRTGNVPAAAWMPAMIRRLLPALTPPAAASDMPPAARKGGCFDAFVWVWVCGGECVRCGQGYRGVSQHCVHHMQRSASPRSPSVTPSHRRLSQISSLNTQHVLDRTHMN
jgi:hypothetical protein